MYNDEIYNTFYIHNLHVKGYNAFDTINTPSFSAQHTFCCNRYTKAETTLYGDGTLSMVSQNE